MKIVKETNLVCRMENVVNVQRILTVKLRNLVWPVTSVEIAKIMMIVMEVKRVW